MTARRLDSSSRRPRNSAGPGLLRHRGSAPGPPPPAAAEPGTAQRLSRAMSVRNVVHTSVGGPVPASALQPLRHPPADDHAMPRSRWPRPPATPRPRRGTMRRLTFGSKPAVAVPAGRQVISDPVRARRSRTTRDLLVTTYTPTPSRPGHLPPARPADLLPRARRPRRGRDRRRRTPSRAAYWRYLTARGRAEQRGRRLGRRHRRLDHRRHHLHRRRQPPLDRLPRPTRLRTEPRRRPATASLNQGISGNRVLADGSKLPRRTTPAGSPASNATCSTRTGRQGRRSSSSAQRHPSRPPASRPERRSSTGCGSWSARRTRAACGSSARP